MAGAAAGLVDKGSYMAQLYADVKEHLEESGPRLVCDMVVVV
jgi:hypothetical protein